MTDFFDWLSAFDAGASTDRLAAQFRLSPAEMRRTTDALVPAFMLGLRPFMADPASWTGFMSRMAALAPRTGAGAADPVRGGQAMLETLFGSEMTQAVARQASLLTGQSTDTVARMMPTLATLTLQSILAMASEASRPDGTGFAGDAGGRMLAETMRRSANAVDAFSRPSAQGAPGSAPPARSLHDLFGGALAPGLPWPSPFGAAPWPSADPFGFFAAFGKTGAPPPPPAPAPPPPASPEPQGDEPPFLRMMANAQSVQADYMRAMLALFDRKETPKT